MIPEFSEPEEEIDEVCKNIHSGRKSHQLLGVNYAPDIVLNALLSFDSHNDPIVGAIIIPIFPCGNLVQNQKVTCPRSHGDEQIGILNSGLSKN